MSEQPTSSGGYEFTGEQNRLINDLGDKMSFVGLFVVIVGVLYFVLGTMAAVIPSKLGAQERLTLGLVYILTGVLQLIVGIWTRQASVAFHDIVRTQGADISHLMDALAAIRKLYTLQYWVILISLIMLIVGVLAFLVLAVWLSPVPVA